VSSDSIVEYLTRFAPFNGLEPEYLLRVAEHSELLSVAAGKIIFRRGKSLSYRYYLVSGTVDLVDSGFNKRTVKDSDASAAIALEESSPTRVSAVAQTQSQILQVEADFLDVVMAWSQNPATEVASTDTQPLGEVDLSVAHVEVEEGTTDWMSALLQSPLFFNVSPVHLQNLLSRFERLSVANGQKIIKEGELGDYFYIIDNGSARVSDLTGKLDVALKPGSFFGEEALVGDAPRNASVVMESDGVVMRLGKQDFKALLQDPVLQFIDLQEFQNRAADSYQLLDVRLPLEYRMQHVPGSRNLPLASLRSKLEGLDPQCDYVVTDDSGRRSQVAAYLLSQQGFSVVILKNAAELYA